MQSPEPVQTTEKVASVDQDASRTPLLTAAPASSWTVLRSWSARRWWVAAAGAIGTVLVVGLPTVLIPNPVFGREIPMTWWAWPVLLVTAVLAGLVGATYVRNTSGPDAGTDKASTSGMVGGVLSYFAVGCPVCNKIALLAFGYSGALQWFAPAQPFLGVLGIGLLVWALHRRLRGEVACAVPTRRP